VESVDLDTVHDQAVLVATQLGITTWRDSKPNESDEVHHEASRDLPELVLGILVLGQDTSGASLLLLVDEDRGRDAGEDQAIEQRERESLVLVRDHGGEEGVDDGQTDDAELADLQALKAGRRIRRKGDRERHSESVGGMFVRMY
jgi:hypothetical protein